jgi:peptidoglycan/LPS O-acetylase OafA/YrhL
MGGLAGTRYWPSLDGIRAVAIGAVIAYHLGYFGGGWLGVDTFFVLSGFLITSLLLEEKERTGGVRLSAFWGRRARRLLPALVLITTVIAVYAWAGGVAVVPAQLRSPAVATLFYFANWQQIASNHGYLAQFHFQTVSPLVHTWSLAIEEQYYVVWPLFFLGLAWLARRQTARTMLGITAVLAVGSAAWMSAAAHTMGFDRAYLGTDTRAWELLLGGMGAMAWRSGTALRRRAAWGVAAAVGVVGAAAGMAAAGGPPWWIWDGGLVGIAGCTLAVIVGCVRHPGGAVARVLAVTPLRFVGRISYSLYLWHWPVIVLLNGSTTGLSGTALLTLRLATMVGGACVSYYLVELPLRRADWSLWWRRALAPVGIFAAAAVVLAATVPPVEASTARLSVPPEVRAAGDPPPPSLLIGRPVSPAAPLRAWLLGDSVMADSAPGITAALQATGDVQVVADSAFGGWGLSTDRTWVSDSAQIIAKYHPEVIIGTWSWDDQLAQGDPTAYLGQLVQALSVVLSAGNGVDAVVLLEFPQQGPSPYYIDPAAQARAWVLQNTSQLAWNDVARQAVQFFPGHAMYVATEALFAPHDRYLTWYRTPMGSWVRARKLDDTHMCPYGAAEFGVLVVEALTPVLHLSPMASGWQLGNWVSSPNYNDPPGACPNDQPPPGYAGVAVPGAPS